MRSALAPLACLAAVALALGAIAAAQTPAAVDAKLQGQMKQLFPGAAAFSPKVALPPHYKAFGPGNGSEAQPLAGIVWWTTEVEPLERGYDGPIKMLVGMDTAGVLTGIIVTDHREPYGYFSVDLPEFAEQFERKSVREPFRVGDDIDAITRATVTVTSASRAVRNSSRRIARAYLVPPEQPKAAP